MEHGKPKRLLRFGELKAHAPHSKSSLYEMIAKGEFPKPVPIGPRAVAWIEDEVVAWQEAQIAKRNAAVADRDARRSRREFEAA